MQVITSVFSSIGGRKNNEDYAGYIYREGKDGVWVVADGLGGHDAGEVASKLTVETILSSFKFNPELTKKNIHEILNDANKTVLNEQSLNKKCQNMHTTVVSFFINGRYATWGHVGDSRLYRFFDGKLVFQTKDHSVSQLSVASGDISTENIRFDDDRNKLLRVIGNGPNLKYEIPDEPRGLLAGEAYLLCTDGFWEYVYEKEMEIDLLKSVTPQEWIQYMIDRIVNRVPMDHDNYTACAVFIK